MNAVCTDKLYELLEQFLIENNFYSQFYTYLVEDWHKTPKMVIDTYEFPIYCIYSHLTRISSLGNKWLQFIKDHDSELYL